MRLLLVITISLIQYTLAAEEITVSTDFVSEINQGAITDYEFWNHHNADYADLTFLVLKNHGAAIEAAARIITSNTASRRKYDDPMSIHMLAKIVSLNDQAGKILARANPELCGRMVNYYKEFKEDYVGIYDAPWLTDWCK